MNKSKLITVLLYILFSNNQIESQNLVLYAGDNQNGYYTVNTNTGEFTPISNSSLGSNCDGVVAIAYDNDSGRAYGQNPNGCFTFVRFEPNGGRTLGIYSTGHVAAGLEFANGELYGSDVLTGNLITINPNNGSFSIIGSHNTFPHAGGGPPAASGWMNGLAFDIDNQVMYGVNGGSSNLDTLYTIDLNTGMATVVGGTGVKLGSLSFGPDGNLYGGGGQFNGGFLYQVDTNTGIASLVGETGTGSTVQGLMLVDTDTLPAFIPTLNQWGLLLLILLLLILGVTTIKSLHQYYIFDKTIRRY